jgi:L-lactate dehydrogenase complex protein LldG
VTTLGTSARAEILASIRAHLAASVPADARGHEEAPAPHPSRALPLLADPLSPPPPAKAELLTPRARFLERARAVGVHCHEVATDADALVAVRSILAAAGVQNVGVSDALVLSPLLGAPGVVSIADLTRDALFACDAGVTAAQLGVGETGTIGLLSASERNRLLSLVPPLHIAVLRAGDIVDTLETALTRVRGEGTMASHAITFITGPSRTSDIELTLAIGVHGPQALHVVLIGTDQ